MILMPQHKISDDNITDWKDIISYDWNAIDDVKIIVIEYL
jgi:hypothetical protein